MSTSHVNTRPCDVHSTGDVCARNDVPPRRAARRPHVRATSRLPASLSRHTIATITHRTLAAGDRDDITTPATNALPSTTSTPPTANVPTRRPRRAPQQPSSRPAKRQANRQHRISPQARAPRTTSRTTPTPWHQNSADGDAFLQPSTPSFYCSPRPRAPTHVSPRRQTRPASSRGPLTRGRVATHP